MHIYLIRFVYIVLFIMSSTSSSALFAKDKTLSLALRFHIVSNLEIPKGNRYLSSWIHENDLRDSVLPEINRIWKAANIEFYIDNIFVIDAFSPLNKSEITQYIANARRDANGKSDPRRIKLLNKLINFQTENTDMINIYLVPYLGIGSQGNAKLKYKRALIAQWTDKPSKGKLPPKRFQLVESLPFKEGSLSRTIAHEIGHLLDLKHPYKNKQTEFNLLMGGKKSGYNLTKREIKQARKSAKDMIALD